MIECATPDATRGVARRVGERLVAGDVVALTGDLGAGKTLFAQTIAATLGVIEPVTSPTFAIVQEYNGRIPVVHVDFYRIESERELFDIGFDELLDRDSVFIVEWAERFAGALPRRLLEIVIDTPSPADDPERRVIRIAGHGPGWDWVAEVDA